MNARTTVRLLAFVLLMVAPPRAGFAPAKAGK